MLLSAPSRRRTRLGAIPLLFLTIVGLLVGGLSAPAFAATKTVSGVVTGKDGSALSGVTVRLGTWSGTTFNPVATAAPGTTAGSWTIDVDDINDYVIQYTSTNYKTAYYQADGTATTVPGAASSPPIDVLGGRTGVDNQLTFGSAKVSGTVKRKGSLSQGALGDVKVELLSTGDSYETTTVATDGATKGTFEIDGVVPGSFTLQFASPDGDGLTTSYFVSGTDSTTTKSSATAFTLTGGQTRTDGNGFVPSDTRSEIGGTITTTDGTPIVGAEFRVYTRNAANAQTGQVSYTPNLGEGDKFVSRADGTWGPLDLTFGKYLLEVRAAAYGTFYLSASGDRSTNPDTAPLIEVTQGVAQSINPRLPASSTTTISGKVVTGKTGTAPGTPVQGVEVSVEYSQLDAQGQTTWTEVQASKAKTAADGTYVATVPPVSNGRTYVVGFTAPGFRTQYYKMTGGPSDTREGATGVEPKIGTPVPNIDANLVRATQVLGRVTDQAGNPLAGVKVHPVKYTAGAAGARGTWNNLGGDTPLEAITKPDGTYVLEVPADTKFRLEFVSADQRPTRYFPSASFPDEGETLSVPVSTALSGKNVTLPSASTIRGALTESTGSAYTGTGRVSAFKQVTWTEQGEQGGVSHTSWFEVPGSGADVSNGAFTVRVPQGSYRLKFADVVTPATSGATPSPAVAEEGFLPGLVGLDDAPSVTVGVEQALTGQSFRLPSVQTVRGAVTDSARTPVVGAYVGAEYTYVDDVLDGVAQISDSVLSPRSLRMENTTQTGGIYSLPLRSRTYRVFAQSTAMSAEDRGYFGDLDEDGTAIPRDVVVNASDVANVDIILGDGALQNTRVPFISGLNDNGSTLTANVGSWSPESGLVYTVTWFYKLANATSSTPWTVLTRQTTRSDGLGNPSADGRTLALPAASPICTITNSCPTNARYLARVDVRRNSTAAPAATQTCAVDKAAAMSGAKPTCEDTLPTALTNDSAPTSEIRALPRITGKAVVGQTLTTDSGVWAQQSTYTYQWYRGLQKIDGATAATYKPVVADIGSNLMVEVRPSGNPNLPPVGSQETARVGKGTFTVSKLPTISGTPQVGQELSANPGTWNPTPASYLYQWLANGQPIPGATEAVYTPVEADVTKVLTVQVTALQDGYTPATRTSQGTEPVSLDGTDPTKIVNKAKPTVEGTAQVGSMLTAKDGDWTNSPSFTYQWTAGGVDITGATAKTYVLTAAEEGKAVAVKVTARRQGFESVTVSSNATNPVAKGVFTNSAKPTISGSVRPGSTVSALPGTWTPSTGVAYRYQWLLDNSPVTGATSSTYSIQDADLGKLLSVRVTATSPGYADSSAVSDSLRVTPDGDTTIEITKASDISGAPVVGQTLRLTVGTTSPAYDTVAIQWLRDGVPVAGRTDTTYAVGDDDLGKVLTARMTYKKTGFSDAVESISTATVTEPTSVKPVKPSLSTVKKIKGTKLVLKVDVTATTQDPVMGDVELSENGRTLATKTLVDGKRKFVVRGFERGFHSVQITFQGNSLVKERTKTITFNIR